MTVFRVTPSLALIALGSALAVQSCAPSQDNPSPSTPLDVSRYVAVGDSYTAGFSEGGLTRASQEYSYPNLIAKSFLAANPSTSFAQPLLEAGSGSGYLGLVSFSGAGYPVVRRVAGSAVRGQVIAPTACGGPDTLRLLTRSSTSATLPQNLGVPGLRLGQIETAGLGNEARATPGTAFNPYFERLLPAADSRTYLQAVSSAASTATFFTFFHGLDDLMPYVRSGGTCGNLKTSTVRNALLTGMSAGAKKLLDALVADGHPGIIARLPDIASLPLLRLGKGNELEDRLQAAARDTLVRVYVQAHLSPAAAAAISIRRVSQGDYVLATTLARVGQPVSVLVGGVPTMLPYGLSAAAPILDAEVLEANELTVVQAVIDGYNTGLNNLAKGTYKMPLLDGTNATLSLQDRLFTLVADRISLNGVPYSLEPVRGNVFSLDYYSLTPRGNGLLANVFIDAINTAYRSNIPAVDVNSLPTTAQ